MQTTTFKPFSSSPRVGIHTRGFASTKATAMKTANIGPTRNLHWVFKVADRTATSKFYQEVLGLTPLRHEEFEEGCAAACNGPYFGKWSKTMIGYGNEDDHFVLELTYNYGVKSYQLGNDYAYISVRSKKAYASASKHEGATPSTYPGSSSAAVTVSAPGGYNFLVLDEDVPQGSTVMTELCLRVTDLNKSLAFWQGFLGFNVVSSTDSDAVVSCGQGQAALRLQQLPQGQQLDRGTAYGRVAFATPGNQLQQLEKDVLEAGFTVHTPYVSLDTPGKATVQVVILQDPDGHEICFVGDEGFRDLSRQDPAAGQLLADAIAQDKSEEWFKKRAEQEAAMAAKGV